MRALLVIVTLGIWMPVSACSDDDVAANCEPTMTLLCDQACDCSTDGSCNVGDGAGAVLYNASRQECLDWYVGIGCNASTSKNPPSSFFTACEAALQNAPCATTGDPSLVLPEACVYTE